MLKKVIFAIIFLTSFLGYSQQEIDLTLKYNSSLNRYEVYARPNFTLNNFTWGPSQISIVTPSSLADNPLTILSNQAGNWGDNSVIYAPSVQAQNDFHGIESGGALINLVSGVETLIFSFALPDGCVNGLRLFNNGIDPDSSQAGMFGGDFSNTIDNGMITDVFNATYNNNGSNCIDAVNDTPNSVTGSSGAVNVINVFDNDTLNGSPVNPSDVILTELNPNPTDPLTLNPDGSIDVAPNTPAGTYTLTYQICEAINNLNCDTAVVTVVVEAAQIIANNDNTSATPINSVSGQNNIINIFTNDTLNGNSFVPSEIIYTTLTPFSNPNITVDTNGNVSVAPNTPAGTYTSTYQICEALNPTNCDDAIITIVVEGSDIVANDDMPLNPVNGTDGGTNVINVLDNDTLNGSPVNPTDIILTELNPNPTDPLTLNPDGSIDVAPNTPAGTYTLTYQICEVLNPSNCDDATVTVVVELKNFLVKVMLQGALFGTSNGIMRDDLRLNNVIPLTEPYTALGNSGNSRFVRPDFTLSEQTNTTVLNVTGNNAIVDWVFVELRDPQDNTIVLHTKAALVQKDGDVVESFDGVSPLRFVGINRTSYFVAVKHRNHIGAMSNSPVSFNGNDVAFDFTSSPPNSLWNGNATFEGAEQVQDNSGKYALWAGNTNSDRKVKYSGTFNDQSLIFNTVINHVANSFNNYNFDFVLPVYSNGDVNMDAKVKYRGVLNDSNYIFFNVITKYLLNASDLYNYDLFTEQIPN